MDVVWAAHGAHVHQAALLIFFSLEIITFFSIHQKNKWKKMYYRRRFE